MALPGRQFGHSCAGPKCTAKWDGDKSWVTCWTCPGGPLAFCGSCKHPHFESAACVESHRRRGVNETVAEVPVIVVEAA